MRSFSLLSIFCLALTSSAVIPSPEQILPDDTLLLLTAPDYVKMRETWNSLPKTRLWNDPAMKPLRDKFLSRWREEVLKPLEQELNVHPGAWATLPQGQLTFAVTRNGWQGNDDQPLGFLLLMDARGQGGLLSTNLTELRLAWMAAGKTLRTEKIRGVEFSIFPFTTNDVPRPIAKFLWRPAVFAPLSSGPDAKQAPASPPGSSDLLLEMLSGLLTASKELVIGQVDSLLVVGNSTKVAEQVVIRLTGGAAPTLGEQAAYQADHLALFRGVPFYGWANVKAIADILAHQSAETNPPEAPDPFDTVKPEKLFSATGLANCKTIAFNLQHSTEGSLCQLFLRVPEPARQGILRLLVAAGKDSAPPSFVPADVAYFRRWRIDGAKAWMALETMFNELSPQAMSAVNLIIETANSRAKQTDPGFDLKKTLHASLGDDIISYEREPRGNSAAELQPPQSMFLLGSPNPEQLAVAVKRLFAVFPQGDAPVEREFLGRNIFSLPVPSLPFLGSNPARPTSPRLLSCAASGSYLAIATDAALLEEYLRSSESRSKTLRERDGLLEAAQKVSGMGSGCFGFENTAETMRTAFEAARNDPGASTNGIGPSLFPGLPAIRGPEENLNEWMDFSLLPSFAKVSQYFYCTVYAGSVSAHGLTLKLFSPTPSSLRNNALP